MDTSNYAEKSSNESDQNELEIQNVMQFLWNERKPLW